MLDAKRAVQCIPFTRASEAELRESARHAHALVVALITGTGIARVSSLGRLEKDTLLGGMITINLALDADRKRATLVLTGLARLNAPRPELLPSRPCPPIGPEPLDKLALLTWLVVPSCETVRIDPSRFTEVCGTSTPETDETCALGWYLQAESYPDPKSLARLQLPRVPSGVGIGAGARS